MTVDQLIRRADRHATACRAQLSIQRPNPRQWHATLFRDHETPSAVMYATGTGDTLTEALTRLLDDPTVE